MKVDFLIVGAGFTGAVLAERIASVMGGRVLIVERRPHVGGNAYDERGASGHLVHRYGPHVFHTNSAYVWEYLSRFAAWRPYCHQVRAGKPKSSASMGTPVSPYNSRRISRTRRASSR